MRSKIGYKQHNKCHQFKLKLLGVILNKLHNSLFRTRLPRKGVFTCQTENYESQGVKKR